MFGSIELGARACPTSLVESIDIEASLDCSTIRSPFDSFRLQSGVIRDSREYVGR